MVSPLLWIPLVLIAALLYRDYSRQQDIQRMCQLLDEYNPTDGWYAETTSVREKMDAICARYIEERN